VVDFALNGHIFCSKSPCEIKIVKNHQEKAVFNEVAGTWDILGEKI